MAKKISFILLAIIIVIASFSTGYALSSQKSKSLPPPLAALPPTLIPSPSPYPSPTPDLRPDYIYSLTVKRPTPPVVSPDGPTQEFLIDQFSKTLNITPPDVVRFFYDERTNPNPYSPNKRFNSSFYLTSKHPFDISHVYTLNDTTYSLQTASPSLLPYLADPKYCQTNSDCIIHDNFCSYGAFNHYSGFRDVWGCGQGVDAEIQFPDGNYYPLDLYDKRITCEKPLQIKYQYATCISNRCVGQNRTVSCPK